MTQPTFQVRFATPTDTPVLARLVDTGPWKVDWSGCTEGWLLAQRPDGTVVGAVNILLGQPVGRVELLSLQVGLTDREKHAAALELARTAIAALWQYGSQVISAHVAFGDKGFKRLIKTTCP